jgi:hypothetical protein
MARKKFWEAPMIRPVFDTQNSTGADQKKSPPKSQAATSLAWSGKPASSSSLASAKDGSSGQILPLDVKFDIGRVASPANMPARVLPVRQGPVTGPGSESPEDAANGADAAKDLLSKDNPYFYDHILYKTDRDYNAEDAKAQALAATLYNYEQKGDNANIAALINGLGPEEAAKLLARAGSLRGPQVNGSGTVYAQDQAGVDQVLAKALSSPGVQLGDGTQQGTLAYSLLQQGTSGSRALSIAGILNAAGTSPQMTALKQQFLDGILTSGKALGKPSVDQSYYANAAHALINGDPALLSRYPGGIGVQQIFGSNAGVPDDDQRLLNGLNHAIDSDLYAGGEPGKDPMAGIINISTMYDVQQYLDGKLTQNESPSQLLANMMSVLGPDRSYAVLSHMTGDQVRQLHIEDSLKALTESGQFTADDAKALALAQVEFGKSADFTQFDFRELGPMGRFIASLPDSPNGTAVKAAYAEGCISGVQQLTRDIASGRYSGDALRQLTVTLNSLSDNAVNVSSNLPAAVKIQLFTKLHAAATQFGNSGNVQQADVLNAYAAGLLDAGKPGDQLQIAVALRAMGGVGANGAIDPNSELGQFLQSALRGQAAFGFGVNDATPNMDIPGGVTHLLNGIAASGDTALGAGVLDAVAQWSIKNPELAQALAAQDTPGGSPGYRSALTSLLDKSFNQFVALNPVDPNATIVRTTQGQTIADLQALSAIGMGPPYDSKIAGDFAGVIGKHAVQFAAYAEGSTDPGLDTFLGGGDRRKSSAVIFGEIMNAFASGLKQSEAGLRALATRADFAAAINKLEARILTDYLRGAGTGLLLLSSAVPGGGIAVGGLTVTEKLVSVFGRIGLFSGSVGTAILDSGALDDTKTEDQAVQAVSQGIQAADLKPSQALEQLYYGWFSQVSQLPGTEGDDITNALMTGTNFGQANILDLGVQDFYRNYDPLGYYHDLTGKYPIPT